jgi:transcriptional regulator with XRE-family HTH domain
MKTPPKCDVCRSVMRERMATRERPYHYDLSGLDDVYLAGILVRECPRGHGDSPVIPRIEELHNHLALWLIQKRGLLHGKEVRFLRKVIGFQGKKFAALLGVSPEHLSRVENGKRKTLGHSSDRVARLAVASVLEEGEEVRELLLRLADNLTAKKKEPREGLVLRPDGKRGWQRAA